MNRSIQRQLIKTHKSRSCSLLHPLSFLPPGQSPMASRNWDAGSENGKEDAFELLQRVKADTPSTLPPNHNDSTTPTSRLPAKTLSLRSKKHVVISAACFGLLVLVLIVGLSWFLSALWIFFPDTSFFKINSPVSCDLEIQNGTIFQVAFTINLRGADHLTLYVVSDSVFPHQCLRTSHETCLRSIQPPDVSHYSNTY